MARGARAALVLALAAGVAFAQDAAVKKPRRPQPTPAAPASTSPPTNGPAGAATAPDASGVSPSDASVPGGGVAVTGAPPPLGLRGPQGLGPAGATPVLRSAVRSRWSTPATIASRGQGACRAQCATSRLACLAAGVEDDGARCNAGWASCLSTCAGLAYGRAPTPPNP